MSAAWMTVIGLALGTALIKGIGPSLLARRELPRKAVSVVTLLPAAVLAALVVTDTFGTGSGSLTLDARTAGLAAALVAIALRLPMLVVLVVAAGATALVRIFIC
jgi:branched-subunit amino acid transport protein